MILPLITNELWDDFHETSLMTWDRDNNKPEWTQDAVDFACVLSAKLARVEETLEWWRTKKRFGTEAKREIGIELADDLQHDLAPKQDGQP